MRNEIIPRNTSGNLEVSVHGRTDTGNSVIVSVPTSAGFIYAWRKRAVPPAPPNAWGVAKNNNLIHDNQTLSTTVSQATNNWTIRPGFQ